MRAHWLVVTVLGLALSATLADAKERKKAPPSIADLKGRQVEVRVDETVEASADKARQRYQEFLDLNRGDVALRTEAMRRLGDLKLQKGEYERIEQNLESGSPLNTRDAISLYSALLAAYPKFDRQDAVLYQLARAYEADAQIDKALATLDRLVVQHADSRYLDEAQFRRGEILFSAKKYAEAQAAYEAVLAMGDGGSFYEQSLYKRGWSQFKQSDNEACIDSFVRLLDHKLVDRSTPPQLIEPEKLSRANRELVEDSFRALAITFSYLDGPVSLDRYLAGKPEPPYAYLLYSQLGDLYVSKERYTDAADTYRAFVKREPNHERAPLLQIQAIEAYKRGGFAQLVLEGKKEFVENYKFGTAFWSGRDPATQPQVVKELKANVKDLAQYYHAVAQQSKKPADYQEAARWYRDYLQSFPNDPDAPQTNYLLADTLFESQQFGEAAREYERTAYAYPDHAKSATAGYAALVAYEREEKNLAGDAQATWHRQSLDSGVKFATTFPTHVESSPVLVRSAREFYDLKDLPKAIEVATLVLAKQPPVDVEKQRTAWTVIANSQFDQGQFDKSEGAYLQVQTLMSPQDPQVGAITERIAASIYKQGEQKQAAGNAAGAVDDFLRVGQLAPQAKIRANADFDAAALLLGLKDWNRAAQVLEAFRRNFPASPLQADVTRKLAVAYLEGGRSGEAAGEFERIATSSGEAPEVQREALWQAAELYQKSGQSAKTTAAYESYVQRFPAPLDQAIEARQRLADMAATGGNAQRRRALLEEIVKADRSAGAARTERSRYLAARASLELATPARDAFRAVRLVAPLKRTLADKKAAMERALKAYQLANEYAVAEVSTAATFETAELYRQLSVDLLKSERPANLKDDELEQYDLLLEEQAYPFEEKAIEIHQLNIARASQGVYDEPVRASYAALAKLKPARFGKTEEPEPFVSQLVEVPAVAASDPAAATAAVPAVPAAVQSRFAAVLQQLVDGQYDLAEPALRDLVATQSAYAAPAVNLGIMYANQGRSPEAIEALTLALQREPAQVAALNQLGLLYRQAGRFAESQAAYEKAIAAAPEAARPHRNFGVLLDLYLQRPQDALPQLETYQALSGTADKQVAGWLAELRQRVGGEPQAAKVGP